MKTSSTILIALISSYTIIATTSCGSGVSSQNAAGTGGGSSMSTDLSAIGKTATGASLKCGTGTQNAYQKFGLAAFKAVTDSIITNVGAELGGPNGTTNLGTSFAGSGSGTLPSNHSNLTTFTGNLHAFLVFLYGGPDHILHSVGTSSATGNPSIDITFEGPRSMQAAHVGFNITSAQYTYFVTQMVVPALTSNGVTNTDVSSCFAPPLLDSAFIASIVGQ